MTVLPFERRAVPATAGPVDLTIEQVKTLLAPINPSRVSKNPQGQSHLEAWDVRRWLNRVFGFAGWADETLELACVAQVEINPGRWTVVYRAQVRLTVKATDGRVLSTWDDAAVGDAINQKGLGAAHDLAMKSALSQALKRCAHNLGDAFGLSLYNDGSREAVGIWSAAHTVPKDAEGAPAVPDDAPVKPEPGTVEQATEQAPAEQQIQRSNRAEAGPWETPPPAPPQQSTAAASGPSRDYLAEAHQAPNREAFDALRAAAVAEGAPQHYLAELDAVAAQKAQQEQQQAPRPSTPPRKATAAKKTPATAHRRRPAAKKATAAKSAPAAEDAVEEQRRKQHAVALAELLAAGKALGLDPSHLDDITQQEAGSPAAACSIEQLTAVTADLHAAAEGAAA